MDATRQSRRKFMVNSTKLCTVAGFALYSFPGCDSSTNVTETMITVDLTRPENEPLNTVGGSVFVANPDTSKPKIIVFRKSTDTVTAFSSKCTHKGGPVGLVQDGKAICEWHQAEYDTEGNVIKGPAKENLVSYIAVLNNTVITITLSQKMKKVYVL